MRLFLSAPKRGSEADRIRGEVQEPLQEGDADVCQPSRWDHRGIHEVKKEPEAIPTEEKLSIITGSASYGINTPEASAETDSQDLEEGEIREPPIRKETTGVDSPDLEEGGVKLTRNSHRKFPMVNGESFTELLYSLNRSTSGEIDKLTSLRTLEMGGEAKIWLLQREKDKKLMVCKAIPHSQKPHNPPHEVQILQDWLPHHERIIQLRDWISAPKSTQLYFDYFDGGDLFEFAYRYHRHRTQIPESFLWHIFLQLCEAVAFMHHGYDPHLLVDKQPRKWQKIIHRDIKPANIFFRHSQDKSGERLYPSLVLADFGMASLHKTNDYIIGTPEFQPPELPKASRKADVWAVGAIMHYLILGGYAPIASKPESYKFGFDDWCCEPIARQVWDLDGKCSPELALCVYGALREDSRKRWSSIRLLNTILDSQMRKKCMKEDWKPLPDWAFPEDPGMESSPS